MELRGEYLIVLFGVASIRIDREVDLYRRRVNDFVIDIICVVDQQRDSRFKRIVFLPLRFQLGSQTQI